MANAEDYKSYTDIEHVRKRPGMYIGGIENTKEVRWVFEEVNGVFEAVQKELECNPGLEQCVLEIFTNAADHVQRCKTSSKKDGKIVCVSQIKINVTDDYVSVYNDGQGIPLDIHPETGMHVPEMIFGNLRTSSNYDDTKKRVVGGTNGVGAKAANIFSAKFVLELQTGKQVYYQEFTGGMEQKTEPQITKATSRGDYTKITYYPDFKAFGMESFKSNDTASIIRKRAYDLSAATGKETAVFYNDEKLTIKDFSDYMTLFIGDAKKVVYTTDRWEVGFALCPYDQPTQISFVNAISTEEGGTHVNHVLDPVVTKLTDEMQSKAKGFTIKKQVIKNNIIVFIKALIENPTFNSQLKRKLETKVADFGSKCPIPDEIITKISKSGVCNGVLEMSKAMELKAVLKTMTSKKTRLNDLTKLDDANLAGTSRAMECTLILTEGDSAKTMALNGIPSAGGSDIWGAFPLRGKFINIRTATIEQLKKNEEILAVNRILGLKAGMTDIKKLRYGRVMIMSDQDFDGFHIKGLLINYFTFYWPELVEQGLLGCMITPIVKIKMKNKNAVVGEYYNVDDYKRWENSVDPKQYDIKYYKGLGTSSIPEAKEYFKKLEMNRINYTFDKDKDLETIERTFAKDFTDDRKDWILEALKNTHTNKIDYNIKTVSVDYVINRELVQFSIMDAVRSIPNIIDGFKPSQRKVLYGSLKYKSGLLFREEIKVDKLASNVSELTNYHHGMNSLQGTIVNMAQKFVGTNNLNLLHPSGQFGSRISGGKDAAAARYISTKLNQVAKVLFNETDNLLLDYIEEEGSKIEPEYYVPIVPMILLNGSIGIGTGWSTDIPCFNLQDIIHNLRQLLINEDAELTEMHPYYNGFKGKIVKESENCWVSYGIIEYVNKNTVEITELPICVWKIKFKEHLDKLIDQDLIVSYTVNDNDETKSSNDVCYRVRLKQPIEKDDVDSLIPFFKLKKNIKCTNMVAFDENKHICKYGSVADIMWTFYEYRLKFYEKRHAYIINDMEENIVLISEKLRFVKMVVNDEIIVLKQKRSVITEKLTEHGFINQDKLLSMNLYSFTEEDIEELEKKLDDEKNQLEIMKSKTKKDLWIEDLDKLEKVKKKQDKEELEEETIQYSSDPKASKAKKTKAKA